MPSLVVDMCAGDGDWFESGAYRSEKCIGFPVFLIVGYGNDGAVLGYGGALPPWHDQRLLIRRINLLVCCMVHDQRFRAGKKPSIILASHAASGSVCHIFPLPF